MDSMNTILVSETGYSSGWGSMPFKNVYGLTPDERAHCRAGGVVLITDCPPSGGGNGTGTTVRRVVEHNGRYYHRVPSQDVLQAAGLADE